MVGVGVANLKNDVITKKSHVTGHVTASLTDERGVFLRKQGTQIRTVIGIRSGSGQRPPLEGGRWQCTTPQ